MAENHTKASCMNDHIGVPAVIKKAKHNRRSLHQGAVSHLTNQDINETETEKKKEFLLHHRNNMSHNFAGDKNYLV